MTVSSFVVFSLVTSAEYSRQEALVPPGVVQATLTAMRDGGLMTAIAGSHLLIGLLLLIPWTRFAGGILQLPMSVGMAAFHFTMLPEGLGFALGILALNLLVITESRLASLFR